jgi:DNA sulfur modification protein DndC
MDLITMEELHEIRRIWVFEKHEIEDSLPRIYEIKTGEAFPGRPLHEHLVLGADDVELLKEICGDDSLHFEMTRSLISVERRFRTMARRAGLFDELEKVVKKSFYTDKDDAVERARAVGEERALRKGKGAQSALDLELGAAQELTRQALELQDPMAEEVNGATH